MFALGILYVVEKKLPFQFLIYKVSIGWIIVFIELVLLFILSYFLLKSNIVLWKKIPLICVMSACLFVWIVCVYLADEYWGYNHNSTLIKSPNDSRTIIVTDIGEWNGHTFCVYKRNTV